MSDDAAFDRILKAIHEFGEAYHAMLLSCWKAGDDSTADSKKSGELIVSAENLIHLIREYKPTPSRTYDVSVEIKPSILGNIVDVIIDFNANGKFLPVYFPDVIIGQKTQIKKVML